MVLYQNFIVVVYQHIEHLSNVMLL